MNKSDVFALTTGGCCLLAICGGIITLIVFYGVFAFANPDSAACYGEIQGKPRLYESE